MPSTCSRRRSCSWVNAASPARVAGTSWTHFAGGLLARTTPLLDRCPIRIAAPGDGPARRPARGRRRRRSRRRRPASRRRPGDRRRRSRWPPSSWFACGRRSRPGTRRPAATQPRCVSRIWPRFIRLGTPSGVRMTSTGVLSSRNAVRPARRLIFEMTLRLPAWRPASLSQFLGDLALLGDEHADQVVDAGRQAIVALVTAFDGSSTSTRRRQLAVWTPSAKCRGPSAAPSPCEDRADQLFLGGQLGLALGRDLARRAGRSELEPRRRRSRTMPRLVEVGRSDSSERFGMSRVISSSPSLVVRASISYFLDVDRGELVSSLDQALGQDDRVLEAR